jgi:excisionase family DNA binding protein
MQQNAVTLCLILAHIRTRYLTDVQYSDTLLTMNGTDVLLTARQLQDLLQVDRITIYRMLADGRLRGFKVGGQWRFSRQAIERWLYEQRTSRASPVPASTAGNLQPSPEALPLSCIQAVQEILAQALGVGAVTTAMDGTPLTPLANCCEFCDLIQRSAEGRRRCAASWRASAAEKGRAPRPTICHAGLHSVWGPIEVQGRYVAAAHAGQYLDQPPLDKAWTDRIRELASACGLDPQALCLALDRVPVLDSGRQQQLSRLLQRMVFAFSEIGEERLSLLGRLQRIAEITQV